MIGAKIVKRIVAMVDAIMLMYIRPANVPGFAKLAILIRGSSVIGVGDRPAKLLYLAHQNHATMTANILKEPDFIILITQQRQR